MALGYNRLSGRQSFVDRRALALQLFEVQVELALATLELLAAASQRRLALVADSKLALGRFGAGVQGAALGVENAQALAQRAQLIARGAQLGARGRLSSPPGLKISRQALLVGLRFCQGVAGCTPEASIVF